MTTIVAMHTPAGTWIGADSRAATGSGFRLATTARKWVWSPDRSRAIGFSGESRTYAVLAGGGVFPDDDDANAVAGCIRHLLLGAGYQPKSGETGAPSYDNSFIYASPMGVWDIDSALSADRIDDGDLWARGSGAQFALGAGRALMRECPDMAPDAVLHRALQAAAAYDLYTGGELFVHRLGASSPAESAT